MTDALARLLVQARADADAAMATMRTVRRRVVGWGTPPFLGCVVACCVLDGPAAPVCAVGAWFVVWWMHAQSEPVLRAAERAVARCGGILEAARAGEA